MTKTPDKPLTPPELFCHGIEITREIRGRIEEARAYYLGRSSREPAQPLSEVFDPMRGPILRYFIETIRTINRTRFIERFCRTAAFREFRQSSEATLEELRLLAIQLAMCLGVPDKTDRRRSVGQALKTSVYFFRIANGRFFRQLPWNGSLVHLLLKNRNNEGFGIYIADRLLNDIAKAFEVRERQLRGETAAAMYDALEVVPLWLRLWRLGAAKLPRKGRAVLHALAVDWRTMPASRMAGVSRPTVDSWKTKFKTHFAQCWRAYERDFAN